MNKNVLTIGMVVSSIAMIAPSGFAYGHNDRQIFNNSIFATNTKTICTNEATQNHQMCILDAQKQYTDNISKCKQDFSANNDRSCEQLMSHIHQHSLQECDSKKVEMQKQCS